MRLLISAGEASGEMYGAGLLDALRTKVAARPDLAPLECFGVGGQLMRAAGCDIVVDASRIAVVGLFEVVKHLPGIYAEFHRVLREVDCRRPDVAVLIDFPDWNLRLARELHARGIPVLYYVSPQLWAWRRGRISLVKDYVRKMLVIFPFEREFYASHGVEAEFVGHPLGRLEPPKVSRACFAQEYRLDESKPWVALLPGSRRGEVCRHVKEMIGAAVLLGDGYEYLVPVASTLERNWVEQQAQSACRQFERPASANHSGYPRFTCVADARTALLLSRAAVVASGTATVEAAVLGTPSVMVYRVAPLTYAFGKRLVKVPFYSMPNLIAGREVIPELVQHDFTAQNVFDCLSDILEEGTARQNMIAGLAEVREKLRGNALVSPNEQAADAVLNVLARR